MKKSLITLGFLLLGALPAAAQTSEVNLLVGGAKTMKALGAGKSQFRHGFEEFSYGMQLDPGTIFKIKVGRMDTTTVFREHDPNQPGDDHAFIYTADPNGQVQYLDAAVEYRFAEPFGYTGLFGGTGLYRQTAGSQSNSGYGFVGGVNGLFPVTRNIGVVAEGALHWAHFYSPRSRYGTLAVGVRFGF